MYIAVVLAANEENHTWFDMLYKSLGQNAPVVDKKFRAHDKMSAQNQGYERLKV